MKLEQRGTVPILVSDRFPARHAFTTRIGGVSTGPYDSLNLGPRLHETAGNVERNREIARLAIGSPGRVAMLNQKVGAAAIVAGRAVDGDALVTGERGLALMTYSADCCLTLLADPVHGVVASVHASRPGTRGGILRASVKVMQESGARPADIVALIGPSIGPCCYDIYGPVLDDWRRFAPKHLSDRGDKTYLDLKGAVRDQLAAAGVGRIDACDLCTFCRADWFYSSRRDGGDTGRFGGFVWLD